MTALPLHLFFIYFNSRFPRFSKANQRPPSLRTHCTQVKRDAGSPTVNTPAAERSRLQAEGLLYIITALYILYYNPRIPSAAQHRARLQSHHAAKDTSAAPQAQTYSRGAAGHLGFGLWNKHQPNPVLTPSCHLTSNKQLCNHHFHLKLLRLGGREEHQHMKPRQLNASNQLGNFLEPTNKLIIP